MAAEAASPVAAASPTTTIDVKPNIIRRPSLIMKPTQKASASPPPPNSATATLSLTSKEWVIPPRPKPGRKPATDTPPSKRKAQNRAAQRAFRERRAARVGELEDQLKQIDDEKEREQDALKAKVTQLEKEVEQYRADLVNWVDRCRRLENELNSLKPGRSGSKPDPPIRPSADLHIPDPSDVAVGCGKCTLETRCQCIDDAFNAINDEIGPVDPQPDKRPHSPDPAHADKRIKVEPKKSLEIDFTAMYSKPQSTTRPEQVSPTAVADPCGFCSDGTTCICAEMAAEQESAQSTAAAPRHGAVSAKRSDMPHQLSNFTPPPSEDDVSISLAGQAQPEVACANGPGTCAQCRADPNSTLFCKSLAASRSQARTQSQQDCCGGRTPGGSCCQSQQASTQAVPLPPRTTRSRAAASSSSMPLPSQKPTVTLTCADAYTTLSRHPAYDRASGDIASWLPKLHASDISGDGKLGSASGVHNRPAMEIDAANVMAVLKDFDRRFGRNA